MQRINAHNKANAQKQAAAKQGEGNKKDEFITLEASLGSYKGLLAQLALLYKMINSFGISSRVRGALSVMNILKSVIPTLSHPNQDVRNAATKILIDVQRFSGCVTEEELGVLPEKPRSLLLEKINFL